jgi:hypothetical protein
MLMPRERMSERMRMMWLQLPEIPRGMLHALNAVTAGARCFCIHNAIIVLDHAWKHCHVPTQRRTCFGWERAGSVSKPRRRRVAGGRGERSDRRSSPFPVVAERGRAFCTVPSIVCAYVVDTLTCLPWRPFSAPDISYAAQCELFGPIQRHARFSTRDQNMKWPKLPFSSQWGPALTKFPPSPPALS